MLVWSDEIILMRKIKYLQKVFHYSHILLEKLLGLRQLGNIWNRVLGNSSRSNSEPFLGKFVKINQPLQANINHQNEYFKVAEN